MRWVCSVCVHHDLCVELSEGSNCVVVSHTSCDHCVPVWLSVWLVVCVTLVLLDLVLCETTCDHLSHDRSQLDYQLLILFPSTTSSFTTQVTFWVCGFFNLWFWLHCNFVLSLKTEHPLMVRNIEISGSLAISVQNMDIWAWCHFTKFWWQQFKVSCLWPHLKSNDGFCSPVFAALTLLGLTILAAT